MDAWDKLNEQMRRDNKAATRQRHEQTKARNEGYLREELKRQKEVSERPAKVYARTATKASGRQTGHSQSNAIAANVYQTAPLTAGTLVQKFAIAGALIGCGYAYLSLGLVDSHLLVWGFSGAAVGSIVGAAAWLVLKALQIAVRAVLYVGRIVLTVAALAFAAYLIFGFFAK